LLGTPPFASQPRLREERGTHSVYTVGEKKGGPPVSTNVITNGSGSSIQAESDFFPFGGERVITNLINNRYKFIGKEQDTSSEGGLTHFFFREYTTNLGRFMSPAFLPGGVASPQSLNRYTSTLDTPVRAGGFSAASPQPPNHPGSLSNAPSNAVDPIDPEDARREMREERRSAHINRIDARNLAGAGGPPGGCSRLAPVCYGRTIFGNTIFDAVAGTPGTFLVINAFGQLSFGFDYGLYSATMAFIDNSIATRPPDVSFMPPGGTFQVTVSGITGGVRGLIPDMIAAQIEQARLIAKFSKISLVGIQDPEYGNLGIFGNLMDFLEYELANGGLEAWSAALNWSISHFPQVASEVPSLQLLERQFSSIILRVGDLYTTR